jgi:hypothetical protein
VLLQCLLELDFLYLGRGALGVLGGMDVKLHTFLTSKLGEKNCYIVIPTVVTPE